MRRLLAVLAAALVATGCADARSGTLGPAPTAVPPAEHTVVPTTPASPTTGMPSSRPSPVPATPTTRPTDPAPTGTITLQLWFVSAGRIVPARRTRPATVATSRLALTELVAGPSPAEAAAGLVTLLPSGTQVVRIADGLAVISPPPEFSAGDPATRRLRQAQVVYTLTQFPTVRRVAFGPGDESVARADYADLLPAIVVTAPAIGQRITSPVTVAGTAQVFEATVSIRILDSAGREIGTAFTTASCGTGCRGDYRATVGYRAAATQSGTIEVYEVSPRDGSRINVVAVPVTLSAGR